MSNPTELSTLSGAIAPEAPAAPAAPKSVGDTLYPEGAVLAEGEKPAEEAPAEGEVVVEEDAPAEAPKPVDPTSYELKLPDGMTVDEPLMTKFRAAAAAANLDNTGAQGLVDLYTEALQSQVSAQMKAFTETRASLQAEVAKMPEFQGAERERSLTILGSAIAEFGDPSVKEMLGNNLLGDHPGFLRMLLNMSKALTEGDPTPVGQPTGKPSGGARTQQTLGQTFYPEQGQ